MPFGARVQVTGAPSGDFYPVTYQTLKGWAHGDWLRGPNDRTQPDDDPDGKLKAGPAWTIDRLHLRSGPGTGFSSLLIMPFGSRVTVAKIAPRNGFYRVAHQGQTGWAAGDYLTNDKPYQDPGDTGKIQRRVRATLVAAGLGAQWPLASKIVDCESSWNPNAIARDSNGYYSRGLWQINDEYHFDKWKRYGLKWNNPVDNTKMAIRLYRDAGNSWKPWSCYFRVTGLGVGRG